jgi:hypothetical protein
MPCGSTILTGSQLLRSGFSQQPTTSKSRQRPYRPTRSKHMRHRAHRTALAAAGERSTEPAICAPSATSAYVPFGASGRCEVATFGVPRYDACDTNAALDMQAMIAAVTRQFRSRRRRFHQTHLGDRVEETTVRRQRLTASVTSRLPYSLRLRPTSELGRMSA